MPRKPRMISSTGIYHITLRSVNQHIIFEEDSDYRKFLFLLSDCRKNYDIEIYAYCLMDNHVHLLLYSPPEQLSHFFQSLGTRFVRWYNSKYLRTGHLFQERFHSMAIESDAYFLSALLYIHNNPVKANICRSPSEYRWSSFNAYYGGQNHLVNTSVACGIAGSGDSLRHYFALNSEAPENELFSDIHRGANHYYTDENALKIFKAVTNLSSTADAAGLERVKRNAYVRLLRKKGVTVKQVARIMGISPTTIKRICNVDH